MGKENYVATYFRTTLHRSAVVSIKQMAAQFGTTVASLQRLQRIHRIKQTGKHLRRRQDNDNELQTYFYGEFAPLFERKDLKSNDRSHYIGGAFSWLRWILGAPKATMRVFAAQPETYKALRALLDEYDALVIAAEHDKEEQEHKAQMLHEEQERYRKMRGES